MLSIPGQRKPIVSKTSWAEKAYPILISVGLMLVVLVIRAVEAIK